MFDIDEENNFSIKLDESYDTFAHDQDDDSDENNGFWDRFQQLDTEDKMKLFSWVLHYVPLEKGSPSAPAYFKQIYRYLTRQIAGEDGNLPPLFYDSSNPSQFPPNDIIGFGPFASGKYYQEIASFAFHPKSPFNRLLIIAPPGAGKSRIIIRGLHHNLKSEQKKKILILFPEEAARQSFIKELKKHNSIIKDFIEEHDSKSTTELINKLKVGLGLELKTFMSSVGQTRNYLGEIAGRKKFETKIPKDEKYDLIIIDEAHEINAPKSKNKSIKNTAKVIRENLAKWTYKKLFMLTATPVANGISDFMWIMDTLNNTDKGKMFIERKVPSSKEFKKVIPMLDKISDTRFQGFEVLRKDVLQQFDEYTKSKVLLVNTKDATTYPFLHKTGYILTTYPGSKYEIGEFSEFASGSHIFQTSNIDKMNQKWVLNKIPKFECILHLCLNSNGLKTAIYVESNRVALFLIKYLRDFFHRQASGQRPVYGLLDEKISHKTFKPYFKDFDELFGDYLEKYNANRADPILVFSGSYYQSMTLKGVNMIILTEAYQEALRQQIIGRAARFQSHTLSPIKEVFPVQLINVVAKNSGIGEKNRIHDLAEVCGAVEPFDDRFIRRNDRNPVKLEYLTKLFFKKATKDVTLTLSGQIQRQSIRELGMRLLGNGLACTNLADFNKHSTTLCSDYTIEHRKMLEYLKPPLEISDMEETDSNTTDTDETTSTDIETDTASEFSSDSTDGDPEDMEIDDDDADPLIYMDEDTDIDSDSESGDLPGEPTFVSRMGKKQRLT